DAKVEPEEAPPLAPLVEVLWRRLRLRTLAHEMEVMPGDLDGRATSEARHAKPLVAQPVGEARIDDAARPRVGGERGEEQPVEIAGRRRFSRAPRHEAPGDRGPRRPGHQIARA